MKPKKKRGSTVCRICCRRCGRDEVHYTRGEIVTCERCERSGTGFIGPPEIVFSQNPIHGDTLASLREEIENCEAAIDLELSGIVNSLRDYYPGAPEQALRTVALHEKYNGEKIRGNIWHIASLRRRMRRLKERRARAAIR